MTDKEELVGPVRSVVEASRALPLDVTGRLSYRDFEYRGVPLESEPAPKST